MIEEKKLRWENFEPLFGTWALAIKPFFDSGGFEPIYDFLKFESRRKKIICPISSQTYRCFLETPLYEMKVVLMGFAPYHTVKRDGTIVADGLVMSCENTGELQPSLENFYQGLEDEFYEGMGLNCIKDPSTLYLAQQGVLLMNSSLTTEKGKVASHQELWEPFTKYVLEEIISPAGVPVIFLGKEAARNKRYLAPMQWSFEVSHPASASYNGTKWDTEGVFTKANKVLKDMNGFGIKWMLERPSAVTDIEWTDISDDLPF